MRLPLATPNESREADRTQDTWAVNCFTEKDDELRLVKRPGLISTIDVVGSGTTGQGIFIWPNAGNPQVISLWDDILRSYDYISPVSLSFDSGWDFGDSSTSSGVALTSEYPVSGWELISVTLPAEIDNGTSMHTGSSIVIRDYAYQDSYSSSGSTWSGATGWSGPNYMSSSKGFYSAGYIWSTLCYAPYLYLLRDAYSAQAYILSSTVPGTSFNDSNEAYVYVLGSYAYAKEDVSGTFIKFARAPLAGSTWTVLTSNLPNADCYRIVIMGSTAYSIPRGDTYGKKVYSSTDFITWTLLTSDWGLGTNTVAAVAQHAYSGKIVVLLVTDDVAVSSDGITWTKSNYSSHVIPTNFGPQAFFQFGADWYAAGDLKWAKLLGSQVP